MTEVVAVRDALSACIACNRGDRPPRHPSPEQQESVECKERRLQLKQLESIPGQNAAIEQAKQQIKIQIQHLQHRETLEDSAKAENRELLVATFGDRSYWNTMPTEDKQQIYRALISRIVVREGQIEGIELNV